MATTDDRVLAGVVVLLEDVLAATLCLFVAKSFCSRSFVSDGEKKGGCARGVIDFIIRRLMMDDAHDHRQSIIIKRRKKFWHVF